MRTRNLIIALALLPATLAAQGTGKTGSGSAGERPKQASAGANASATGRVSLEPPREFSVEGRARLEALYKKAKESDVPGEPIAKRVSEGRAKGASEETTLTSAGKVEGNLEVSHQALMRAGRKPSPGETESGANAMERGVTSVQLEAMAKSTPGDRSLVVAFDVLSKLAARGVPVTQALAQVQAKLDAHAPDASITSLVGVQVGRGGRQ